MSQRRVVDAQEDVRLVADMVLVDLRMAGFMTPPMVGVSVVDGGTTGSDWICASDPIVYDETILDDAMDRFDGTGLASTLGAGTSVSLTTSEMDIDGDGNDDYTVGQGIIVADADSSHCGRITNISSGTVTFTPVAPPGFAATSGPARAVPAIVYELSGTNLLRNNQLLASQVEDVQLEFGIDTDGDGEIGSGEFPLHGLNGEVTANVKGVRLSVLTRTTVEDPMLDGPGRQKVGNRDAAASGDAYRRRLVSVMAAPRNLL